MKFVKTVYLFLLTSLVGSNLFAQENQDVSGYLNLLPNHGMVAIDGEISEISEPRILTLPVGKHTIRYVHNITSREWKPPFVLQPFGITHGDTLTINLQRSISVHVNSKPSGAELYVESIYLGTTPRSLSILVFGNQVLSIRKGKYQDKSITITKDLEENPNVNVSLTPHVELKQSTEVAQILVGMPEKRRGKIKLLKYGLASATIGAAIAGLILKEQADDAFASYERSANRERIDFFFDRAESRDNLARISYLVSEAALLATVYLFIKEQSMSTSYQRVPIEVGIDPQDRRRVMVGYKFGY